MRISQQSPINQKSRDETKRRSPEMTEVTKPLTRPNPNKFEPVKPRFENQ